MATQYQVSGTLKHDGQTYRDGEAFSTDDAAVEAALRRVRAILLPEEYAAEQAASGNPAAQRELAAQRQSLEDEVARLKAELAAARGEQSSQQADASGEGAPPKSDGE